MALHRPDPPAHVTEEFKAGLADFIDPDDPLGSVFLDVHPGKHVAHQVFSLGSPKAVGWRFVAAAEALDLVGACHVCESPGGDAAKLMGLSRVSKLADVFKLIQQCESLERVQKKAQDKETYDFLVLRIPGLIEAFWIKSRSQSPDADLVVPFYSLIRNPKWPMQALGMTDFLKDLYPVAQSRLNFKDREVM
jgi:hypothetical protein